jgi:WXG100 family type VII secretion target
MSLLPDPAELRALAGRIDSHADAARKRADRLGAAVAATGWHGRAARAFEGQAETALAGLRAAAGRLDDAADALRRHADNVDSVLAAITGLVRAGVAGMEELLALPADALRGLGDGLVSAGGGVISTVGDVADSVLGAVGL